MRQDKKEEELLPPPMMQLGSILFRIQAFGPPQVEISIQWPLQLHQKMVLGPVFFGSSQLIADVNNWITNPNQNFGWIVITDEGPNNTSARRFNSKDGSGSAPTLRVTYLTTGLTESTSTKKLEIYPIPAEDYLIIEHRRNVFTNEVRVFDTNGNYW